MGKNPFNMFQTPSTPVPFGGVPGSFDPLYPDTQPGPGSAMMLNLCLG
ncbi:MAG: hypothetical protein ABFD62_13215 [Syntrophaceae bacterium]